MGINILITGPAHSGTRLLVDLFKNNKNFYLPKNKLNSVNEFNKLHKYFIECADNTDLNSEDWEIDKTKLFNILDEYYYDNINLKITNTVLKMPYYPLRCIDYFQDYFKKNLVVLYAHKKFEQIYKIHSKRNEVNKYMNNTIEMNRQLKKVNVIDRLKYIQSKRTDKDKLNFFYDIYKFIENFKTKNNFIKNYIINTESLESLKKDFYFFIETEKLTNIDLEQNLKIFGTDKSLMARLKSIFVYK